MNVIDNLHPISPVGGSLPAGGFAHAGHAYYASLITPYVTGDFLGVPQPSNYANKMKQPIVEAPSVTWKSAGPGRKRLKLVKKPDGSYGLAPEDDSFDGFLDYGGDERQDPPGLNDSFGGSLSITTSFTSLRGSPIGSSLDSLVSGSSNYPSSLLDEREEEGTPSITTSFPSLRGSTASRSSNSGGGALAGDFDLARRMLNPNPDYIEGFASLPYAGSSSSGSKNSVIAQIDAALDMLMDQTLPETQVFADEKVKIPSMASSTTETSGSVVGPKSSSDADNQPESSSTPGGIAKGKSPTTHDLLGELGKKVRESYYWGVKETSATNIQETPPGAEAFSNDHTTPGFFKSPLSPYVQASRESNRLSDLLEKTDPRTPEYDKIADDFIKSLAAGTAALKKRNNQFLAKQGQSASSTHSSPTTSSPTPRSTKKRTRSEATYSTESMPSDDSRKS